MHHKFIRAIITISLHMKNWLLLMQHEPGNCSNQFLHIWSRIFSWEYWRRKSERHQKPIISVKGGSMAGVYHCISASTRGVTTLRKENSGKGRTWWAWAGRIARIVKHWTGYFYGLVILGCWKGWKTPQWKRPFRLEKKSARKRGWMMFSTRVARPNISINIGPFFICCPLTRYNV